MVMRHLESELRSTHNPEDKKRAELIRSMLLERGTDFPLPSEYSGDYFTFDAIHVFFLAEQEAVRLGQDEINEAHVLIGLLEFENLPTPSRKVLVDSQINLTKVRSALEFIEGGPPIISKQTELRQSESLIATINSSVTDPIFASYEDIDSNMLLYGILNQGNNLATGILESLGHNIETVKERVIRAI